MNYMEQVAKMLGVELGEKFQLFDSNYNYYFTNNGIVIDKDGYACASNDVLCNILYGNYTIKRKPWKPQCCEGSYFIDKSGLVCWDLWGYSYEGILLYKLGNCYRTKEEAELNSAKWKAFYESDEVLEV